MTSAALLCAAVPWAAAAPLNAVDEARRTASGLTVEATKLVRRTDPYMPGHFPGLPVYPGTFVVESVRQAVQLLARDHWGSSAYAVLRAVHTARFSAPLPAGDTLHLRATGTLGAGVPDLLRVEAWCRRGDGRTSATLRLGFRLRCGPGSRPAGSCQPPGGQGHPDSVLEYGDLLRVLPHRPPMLLVDRVLELGPGRRLTAEKEVRIEEPCYAELDERTPPGAFAYPPSLLLESFGQACAVLWSRSATADVGAGGVPVVVQARDCVFHSPVYPGDTVRHDVRIERLHAGAVTLSGTSRAGGRPVLAVGSALAVIRQATGLSGESDEKALPSPFGDPREKP
ncbi:hypothetical protein ADL21_02230 [Streptomyces albus subsp. albus]|nr:hypothetical protein ADL21_02230 [Streptomyces albus subsp. albus]